MTAHIHHCPNQYPPPPPNPEEIDNRLLVSKNASAYYHRFPLFLSQRCATFAPFFNDWRGNCTRQTFRSKGTNLLRSKGKHTFDFHDLILVFRFHIQKWLTTLLFVQMIKHYNKPSNLDSADVYFRAKPSIQNHNIHHPSQFTNRNGNSPQLQLNSKLNRLGLPS